MNNGSERRRKPRTPHSTNSPVELQFQERRGVQQVMSARLVDLTTQGCGLEVGAVLAVNLPISIHGDLTNRGGGHKMHVRGRVAWCRATSGSGQAWRAGIEFETPIDLGTQSNGRRDRLPLDDSDDYYEILQLSPNADAETIQRVFRILATRHHPDNKDTGNADRFRKIHEAYTTLTDPVRRAAYDVDHQARKKLRWKIFDQPASAQGRQAERTKRKGVLDLLYTKRVATPDQPGVSILELEEMLGVPREHLDFSLWFLKESGFVTRTDNGKFCITIKGVVAAEAAVEPAAENRPARMIEAPEAEAAFA